MNGQKGFSLVELIIATTIMVVLSAVAMVSYTGTNKRARDSRRVTDIQKMTMALEMARQAGSTYPENLTDLVPNYLLGIPVDPKNYSYYYSRQATNYTYVLEAQMEDLGSTNGSYGANCSGTCNYRVVNP